MERVARRDNVLRRFLQEHFGDLDLLEGDGLCWAIQAVFLHRWYWLRLGAAETRDSFRRVFAASEAPEGESQGEGRVAQHVASLRELARRLDELGEWCETTVLELGPVEPLVEVSEEELLFGPH